MSADIFLCAFVQPPFMHMQQICSSIMQNAFFYIIVFLLYERGECPRFHYISHNIRRCTFGHDCAPSKASDQHAHSAICLESSLGTF